MKIGITTITNYKENGFVHNYGNILQNYALQTFLKNNNFNAETIYYKSFVPEYTKSMQKTKKNDNIIQLLDDIVRVINRKIQRKKLYDLRKKRKDKFTEFINNYIAQSKNTYTHNSDLTKLNKKYDFFITGSDQVWNPYYEGANPFYYLGFAEKNKRIAYAPSFGVDHIPESIEKEMNEWIDNFDSISIREKVGQKILKQKFKRESQLVCDPVFLLEKKEWEKIIPTKNKYENDYFAIYLLGKKTVETKRKIKKIEKITGLKGIDIYTADSPKSKFLGPIEFLECIKNSKFLITDSFHGTAFSIIFNTPFVIVDRNEKNKTKKYKMNNRIDNLISLLNAKNRNIDYLLNNIEEITTSYNIETSKNFENLINDSKKYLLDRLK